MGNFRFYLQNNVSLKRAHQLKIKFLFKWKKFIQHTNLFATHQSQHALGLLHRPAASEEADDEEQGSGGDDRVNPVPDARIVGYQILERLGSLQRPHAQAHHASTAQLCEVVIWSV